MLCHSRRAVVVLTLSMLVPALVLLAPNNRSARAERRYEAAGLHLVWVRHEPRLSPAWPDQPRFSNDDTRRPVIAGDVVLLTSSRHDSVTAVDRLTGGYRWQARVDGPVRFAPAVWRDRAYFACDDGHLACVRLSDGKQLWRFRGGPTDRLILGNERLISTWPARGAPAVAAEKDGGATVYFAAGIWPFMGIFIHALDARTGEVRWTNSGDGSTYIKQPHHTDAYAGIAPQGTLVVSGERLLIPGGRSIPACFDRHTGKRLHYRLSESSKVGGGPDIALGPDVYHNGGGVFEIAEGKYLGQVSEPATFAGPTLFTASAGQVRSYEIGERPTPRKVSRLPGEGWLGTPTASVSVGRASLLVPADGRLFGATTNSVFALDLPLTPERGAPAWKAAIDGTPVHLVASGRMVLVSTREGRIYAFGPKTGAPRTHCERPTRLPSNPEASRHADALLAAAGVKEGYAVLWGAGDGSLVAELLRKTSLRLLVFDPDGEAVDHLRDQLQRADIGGGRVSVRVGDPVSTQLPPYLASLVIHQASTPESLESLASSLRPYGGVAVLPGEMRDELRRLYAARSSDAETVLEHRGDFVLIRRPGAIPGSADWTHQNADAANTRVSRDRVVKAPLGVLWFGGPGNQAILPRHGHGPVPQVSQGRLLIEGPDVLRAIDIYTGRLLWETRLPGLGKAYDNHSHQPGANSLGSNYVSTPEGVYVAYKDACLRLDPATGKTLERFVLPLRGKATAPLWTFLNVAGDSLIAGSGQVGTAARSGKNRTVLAVGASKRLTVLDRRSGQERFSIDAKLGFRHNSIIAGNGMLFAIDRPVLAAASAKGKNAPQGEVVAFDLASGKRLWKHDRDAFGTWLSYSATHDVLVESGLMSRDTLADEAPGMRAYQGRTGRVLWNRPDYFGPSLIHGDRILKGGDARAGSGTACDLRTGKPIERIDTLTGGSIPWRWERTHGCNTPAASEHLVLFRSGSAGYYDLCNDGGTGNLGGFRSSCTLNLIAAGGVLTAPDFTRTCSCSYQNQTSIGLIHAPEVEAWSFTTNRPIKGIVRQVGVNLAAPGSRKADNGTLWLEYPPVGGPSPRLSIRTTPTMPTQFRMHTSQVVGPPLAWVGASGLRGLRRLEVPLGADKAGPRRYTVRMVFLEPDALAPGQRLFDASLQGKDVLSRFDIVAEAGGSRRVLVREFRNIMIDRNLTIDLRPCPDADVAETLLSGIEVLPDGW
jgi:outer membrane protein assembly factor BamB